MVLHYQMKAALRYMYYTRNMKIIFYFDPSCPFCWITSRWLLMVAEERDLQITWKPFSLAIKNEALEASADPHRAYHVASRRLLRVMLAAQEQNDASLIELYSTSGALFHIKGNQFDDQLISSMLNKHNLPAELIEEADKTTHDELLRAAITAATDIAGKDVGVPTIVFTSDDGDQQGFFGPVLQELPQRQAGLDLWDGLSKLATNSSFYELKRNRPGGMPNVQSTAV